MTLVAASIFYQIGDIVNFANATVTCRNKTQTNERGIFVQELEANTDSVNFNGDDKLH